MTITRRVFLKGGAMAVVGTAAIPSFLSRAAFAAETASQGRKRLVVIFQRGAADGLNVVVPHGESSYYTLRPTIAIPRQKRDRSRRLFRTASLARAAQAAVRSAASRDRRCGGLARSDAVALRRAGLHGVGHARPEGDERRVDESRTAEGRGQGVAGPRRLARADGFALDGGAQSGDRAANHWRFSGAGRASRKAVREHVPGIEGPDDSARPDARRSRRSRCCKRFRSGRTRRPVAQSIRAARSARA